MSDLISRQVLDLWNRYKPTIAVDAIEYDRELKQLLSTNLAEVGTDLISRQAAISAICNACGKIDCDKTDKCEKLQLPPASCSEFPNNSDTINRQAAIDAIDECYCGGEDSCGEPWIYKENAVEAIQMIEPILPAEPKRGKWIDGIIPNDSGGLPVIVCDQCNTFFPLQFGDGHNYCPNCGAKMEGTE